MLVFQILARVLPYMSFCDDIDLLLPYMSFHGGIDLFSMFCFTPIRLYETGVVFYDTSNDGISLMTYAR